MYKFIRKYQKKLLAVFAAGLMVAFIWQTAIPNAPMRDRSGIVVGRIGADNLTLEQVHRAEAEWDMLLRSIVIPTGQQPPAQEFVSLLEIMIRSGQIPQQMIVDMKNHPETYALLQEEARRMGVQVSAAVLDDWVANRLAIRMPDRIVPLANASSDMADQVRAVLYNFLAVLSAFDRATDVVKISQPLLEHGIIGKMQKISLRVVPVDAQEFLPAAPDPTPQQLTEHFNRYADLDPELSERDPESLGFGYRYPNRVKLQYVSIDRDEVRKLVKATKDDYTWELEAHKYYLRNQREFAIDSPTTHPATQPTTQPFELVRSEVLEHVMQPDIDRIMRDMQTRIQTTLLTDYDKLQPELAQPSTSPSTNQAEASTASPAAGAFKSYDYLKSLAESIQKEFGVLPAVGSVGEFKSAEELAELKGIGQARVGGSTLPLYATNMAEPFVPPQQRKLPQVLPLYKPSSPIADPMGNVYFVRITATEAAHKPADMSDVVERVREDWKKAWAFDQAKSAAARIVEAAGSGSLESAAGDRKISSTEAFEEYTAEEIEGINLPSETMPYFKRQAFRLVADAARSPGSHPLRAIEIPRQAIAFAAELQTVTTDPRPLQSNLALAQGAQLLRREFAQPIAMNWFTYRGVVNRLNYTDNDQRNGTASAD